MRYEGQSFYGLGNGVGAPEPGGIMRIYFNVGGKKRNRHTPMPFVEAVTSSRPKAHGEEKYKRGNNGVVLAKWGDV